MKTNLDPKIIEHFLLKKYFKLRDKLFFYYCKFYRPKTSQAWKRKCKTLNALLHRFFVTFIATFSIIRGTEDVLFTCNNFLWRIYSHQIWLIFTGVTYSWRKEGTYKIGKYHLKKTVCSGDTIQLGVTVNFTSLIHPDIYHVGPGSKIITAYIDWRFASQINNYG